MKILKIFAFVLLSIATLAATAQFGDSDGRGKGMLGIKAGINYSGVYNPQTEAFRGDSKFGFAGGIVVHVPIGIYLGVQSELLLSQKGFEGEGLLLGSKYNFTRTTTYLDIPILLALKPASFLTLLLGPQYSYLLRQKDVFSNTQVSFSQEQQFENDNIRQNIFGFVVGADIIVNHAVLGLRAGWDIMDNHGDGTSGTPRYKNTWVQATVGYYLFPRNL